MLSACLAGILSAAPLVSTTFAYSKTAEIPSWAREEAVRAETLEIFSSGIADVPAPKIYSIGHGGHPDPPKRNRPD